MRTSFILSFVFSLLFTCQQAGAQQSSLLNLSPGDDFSSFAMLDSAIAQSQIVFTGENHVFRKSNYQLEMKMMRYLYHKAGFRHFFLEFGYSRGWLVNKYVQSGDTSYLRVLKNYSYEEYTELYKELHAFNATLPDGEKIMIHGIDIERSFATPVKVMSIMVPKADVPEKLRMVVESIHALAAMADQQHQKEDRDDDEEGSPYAKGGYYNMEKSLTFLLRDLDSNRALMMDFMGDYYPDFARVEEGIRAEFVRDEYGEQNTVQQYIYRENYMHRQFRLLLDGYPGGKFYGQFGRCHTSLVEEDVWCSFYHFRTLATRLNADEDLKGKLLSIAIYYPNGNEREKGIIDDNGVKPYVEKASEEGLTLFSVKQDSSSTDPDNWRFPFLIVNRNHYLADNLKATDSNKNKEQKEDDIFTRIYYEARYSMAFLQLDPLASALSLNHDTSLQWNEPLTYWGGAFTVADDYMYVSYLYDGMVKSNYQLNDSTSLRMRGMNFRMRMGGDLVWIKQVDISPYGGIGFSRMKLTRTMLSSEQSNGGLFASDNSNTDQWTNPAVVVEAGIDIRFNWKFLFIGGTASWQGDLSNKQWRSGGEIDQDSPSTSFKGFYISAAAGLYGRF